MKQFTSLLLILLSVSACSKKDDKSFLENILLLFARKDRVTISGSAVKGLIKNAAVNVHPINSDGTCNLASTLASEVTDATGNYSLVYNKANGVVCVRIKGNADGSTTMFDEKTLSEIPVNANSDFSMTTIFAEDKLISSARKNNSVSPFSRMMANRFASLMASSNGSQSASSLSQRASKEVVIRFGLSGGLSASNSRSSDLIKNTAAGSVSAENYPDLLDLNIDFKTVDNPITAKSISILAGFSQLANRYKRGATVNTADVDAVIESFAKDFEDGKFDGKDGKGSQVFIGSGTNQLALPADSITNILIPAIKTFFSEGGTLNIGQGQAQTFTLPATTVNQIQFADSIPIVFGTNTFTIGGTISDLYTAGLVLQNGAGEELPITHSVGAPKTFTFNTKTGFYNVTVKTQPLATTCTVTNGTGAATADVTNVAVSCLTLVGNGVLRPLNNLGNTVTTFAGHPTNGNSNPDPLPAGTNGIGTAALFNDTSGIATDGINLYLGEGGGDRIRKIVIATGQVTTLVPQGASINNVQPLTLLGDSLYAAGYSDRRIHKIDIATGAVTVFSGSGTNAFMDGTAATAQFVQPEGGLTTDGKDLYLSDSSTRIRKISVPTGDVSTFAGSVTSGSTDSIGTAATFSAAQGITSDGTNLYVADGSRIRRIVIATAVVTTIAGSGVTGSADGTGTGATFSGNCRGMVTDGANLYIVDSGNTRIRKMVISTGVVTTLAGNNSGEQDGVGSSALFRTFRHITTNGTSLYISDTQNNKIRRLQ